MSYQPPFYGYLGSVWNTLYRGLIYLQSSLETANVPADAELIAATMFVSLLNGLDAINANDYLVAWQQEIANIEGIEGLSLTLDPTTLAIFNARAAAYVAAASALAPLIPSVSAFQSDPSMMENGTPLIPDMGWLTFYQEFDFETPPAGLTTTNFVVQAQGIVTAFNNVAQAIQVVQGNNLTQAYDTATRLAETANVPAQIVAGYTSGSISDALPIANDWNQVVTLPALTADAALISTAPFSLTNQQQMTVRYIILNTLKQIGLFLLVLRSPQITQVNTTTLNVNESLMDVAARALGDFEQWQQIALLNNLLPPYVGSTSGPNIAGWGTKLILPTPGVNISAVGVAPSYSNNFLGVDLYFGPINGAMPAWTGDFQTIAGYNNLSISLGRRLQTTIGNLIYHSDFGSRIPPEVGNVQVQSEAQRIAAFGQSALLADPRVASVLSAIATLEENFAVAFKGVVQPAGFGSTPTSVNEVLSPSP